MRATFGISKFVNHAVFSMFLDIDSFTCPAGVLVEEPFTFKVDDSGHQDVVIRFSMKSKSTLLTPQEVLGAPNFDMKVDGVDKSRLRYHSNGWLNPYEFSLYYYIDSFTAGDEAILTLEQIKSGSGKIRWPSP